MASTVCGVTKGKGTLDVKVPLPDDISSCPEYALLILPFIAVVL